MQQTKEIPVVEIQTGAAFLQDKIVDETHCYVCKKEFNKFDDKDMLLLRLGGHKMGFCCPEHNGIVQEFIKQYGHLPGGWEEHVQKVDNDIVADNTASTDSVSTNPYKKARKRNR